MQCIEEYHPLCLSITPGNVLWRGNKAPRFLLEMDVVWWGSKLSYFALGKRRRGEAREKNNQINLEQAAVFPRDCEKSSGRIYRRFGKRIASIFGVKPFKKDPDCCFTKLHRNDCNNIPVNTESHLRNAQTLVSSFVRREHQSFLRRIHGTTSSHFADS